MNATDSSTSTSNIAPQTEAVQREAYDKPTLTLLSVNQATQGGIYPNSVEVTSFHS